MTVPAAKPDPQARQLASGAVDAAAGGGGPSASSGGELVPVAVAVPVPRRIGRGALPGAAVISTSEGPASQGAAPVRRLRPASPVQLELVCDREGPGPEVVWASMSERSREQVLVLLARLIDSGAVEEGAA